MPALGFRVAMSRGASFVAGFQGSCTWYNMFSVSVHSCRTSSLVRSNMLKTVPSLPGLECRDKFKFCWLIRVGGTYVCILYFVTVAFVFDSFLSLSLSRVQVDVMGL